ncbi:hypothetical protein [Thermomonas sp.]
MFTRLLIPTLLLLTACGPAPPAAEAQRPQQAGQPLDPLTTAVRLAEIRGNALIGNQAGVQRGMQAFSEGDQTRRPGAAP